MSRMRTLTASLIIGAASLTGCALSNSEPVSAVIHEEDPAFDCLTDGNQVCGASMADEEILSAAWEEWDKQEGYRQLRVDPSREFRVDVNAFSVNRMEHVPGSITLVGSDGWRFQYVVTYL